MDNLSHFDTIIWQPDFCPMASDIGLYPWTYFILMPGVILTNVNMLSIIIIKYDYVECHYAECRGAQ
jgi:hypothetical protein